MHIKQLFYIVSTITLLAFSGCSNSEKDKEKIVPGKWQISFFIAPEKVPVNAEIKKQDSSYVFTIINGKEKIVYKDSNLIVKGNKILLKDPSFETWFEGKIVNNKKIIGKWYKSKDYSIPFIAIYGKKERFLVHNKRVPENLKGKWKTTFSPGTKDAYQAIGLFKQDGNEINGTFVTEFGDYRFLAGVVDGDSLKLSSFDGSHIYLFKARYYNDTLKGKFWSGSHWKEQWFAVKNDTFKLRDPEELTYLKEGYTSIQFKLPDLDSNIVEYPSEEFDDDKVVIINIMGSWCSNCKDELLFLSELYKKYHKDGLEIISVAFERSNSFKQNVEAVKKEKVFAKAQHIFVIGGKASKVEATKVFPMLNQIISFPTSIFIDKRGRIRKIHTGFYGPATGKYYTEYCQRTEDFIRLLLNEQ
jgi:thiol-disulfide isomerase/thioredoxin